MTNHPDNAKCRAAGEPGRPQAGRRPCRVPGVRLAAQGGLPSQEEGGTHGHQSPRAHRDLGRTGTSHAGTAADAGDPVLLSKITAPGLPGWAVPRPRIAAIMAESARVPLTTVTGPPGAGKTMSIALWASARTSAGPCAWMTVDDYDNRPGVFWSYVTAALRAAGVPVTPLSPAMASGKMDSEADHGFLLRLASELAGQDPPVDPRPGRPSPADRASRPGWPGVRAAECRARAAPDRRVTDGPAPPPVPLPGGR